MQCSECDRPAVSRGWCQRHYGQHRRAGDFEAHKAPADASEALWRVGWDVDSGGCWNWRGRINPDGYGVIKSSYRGEWFGRVASRVMYCVKRGRVPDSFHVDHLCRNHRCVNPDHLEAVEPKVNTARGNNGEMETCVRNHSMSGDNLSVHGNGRRYCRKCRSERAWMKRHGTPEQFEAWKKLSGRRGRKALG